MKKRSSEKKTVLMEYSVCNNSQGFWIPTVPSSTQGNESLAPQPWALLNWSFTHLLMSPFHVPGPVLSAWDIAVNITDKIYD